MNILLTILLALFCNLCAAATQTIFIEHPAEPGKKIEVVLARPEGEANYPLLILLHGWSMANGAADFKPKVFDYWVNKKVAVAALSLPGFGKSDGPRDYCGKMTMDGLNSAIDSLKAQLPVTAVGGMGFGVGGTAILLLAGQRSDLCCAVAAHALFNLNCLKERSDPLRRILSGQKLAFDYSPREIFIRSPLSYAARIKTPLFLLHRVPNPHISEEDALIFQDAIITNGGSCTLKFCEKKESNQKFSHKEVVDIAGDWVLQHLFTN